MLQVKYSRNAKNVYGCVPPPAVCGKLRETDSFYEIIGVVNKMPKSCARSIVMVGWVGGEDARRNAAYDT